MKSRSLFWLVASLSLVGSAVGCNCGHVSGTKTDGGDAGKTDASIPDSGPGSQCISTGTACSTASGSGTCCSGICDVGDSGTANGTCAQPKFCTGPAGACTNNTDCCSNSCQSNQCSSVFCHDVGQSCSSNSQCCTGDCNVDAGTCQSLPGQTCNFEGQACGADAGSCCSTNCQGGLCVVASWCHALSDVCYKASDCCSGNCSAWDGGAGMCIANTANSPNCIQDGNPCAGGTNCCSKVCADPGTGVTVCSYAGGCVVTGDLCDNTLQCCGGTGTSFDTGVVCQGATSTMEGACNNGQSCSPPGTICGQIDGGHVVNANANCCIPSTLKGGGGQLSKDECQLDSSGIPRCFGIETFIDGGFCVIGSSPTCCVDTGNGCAFKDQCCNGQLCLSTDGGASTCQSASCLSPGTTCVPTADAGTPGACCPGMVCQSTSELGTYACSAPSDAGTACVANGLACTSSGQCCSASCIGGVCQAIAACQPQNGACSISSDCCSGLGCVVPTGSSTGTCQPSACPGLGQSCSPSNLCCTGYTCENSSFLACDGGTPCTCQATIG